MNNASTELTLWSRKMKLVASPSGANRESTLARKRTRNNVASHRSFPLLGPYGDDRLFQNIECHCSKLIVESDCVTGHTRWADRP